MDQTGHRPTETDRQHRCNKHNEKDVKP